MKVGLRLELLAGHRDLAKLELSLAGEHHREGFSATSWALRPATTTSSSSTRPTSGC